MKLSKLYSNDKKFKNIKFNPNGLNVIYAKVKSNVEDKKNSHDLGKTKFAELVNFMLLKGIDKNHFLLKIKDANNLSVSIFNDYIFYLELLLNSGEYLTIRRTIATNTKISFSLNVQSSKGFEVPLNWDFENLTIGKAKKQLSKYLSLDFFHNKPYDYRKSINYSLRTQDDFKDVYKLNKFTAGKDIHWKPFVFDLLGFEGELLRLKYSYDTKINEINKFINDYKAEFAVRVEDRDEIIAEKDLLNDEYKEIEYQIDRFNFYNQDTQLVSKGVDDIENRISDLNSISYQLNYEVDKLQKSIKNNFSFDLNKVKKVFEETSLYFSDQLVSDYENLIKFNKSLTSERNKLLKSTLKVKTEELNQVRIKLLKLNKERENLLIHLTDTDTFSKFKFSQKELIKIASKVAKFQEKLEAIDRIISKEEEIEGIKTKVADIVSKIRNINLSTEDNQKYKNIRTKFSKFYKAVMDENAVLTWKINSNNNVDFIPPKVKAKQNIKIDTAKDEGNTYMKILCVVFDLAILTVYNPESYYRFVYHDDVLSQQDNGIKTRLLELLNNIFQEYNIQYIISVIKSDLPVDDNNDLIYFDKKQIILELDDASPSGTLFGFEF